MFKNTKVDQGIIICAMSSICHGSEFSYQNFVNEIFTVNNKVYSPAVSCHFSQSIEFHLPSSADKERLDVCNTQVKEGADANFFAKSQ